MSRRDIADYVGLSPEAVSRASSQLGKDGMVAFPSAHIGRAFFDRRRSKDSRRFSISMDSPLAAHLGWEWRDHWLPGQPDSSTTDETPRPRRGWPRPHPLAPRSSRRLEPRAPLAARSAQTQRPMSSAAMTTPGSRSRPVDAAVVGCVGGNRHRIFPRLLVRRRRSRPAIGAEHTVAPALREQSARAAALAEPLRFAVRSRWRGGHAIDRIAIVLAIARRTSLVSTRTTARPSLVPT